MIAENQTARLVRNHASGDGGRVVTVEISSYDRILNQTIVTTQIHSSTDPRRLARLCWDRYRVRID